jgi:dihydrolipoamide dehydrogenase
MICFSTPNIAQAGVPFSGLGADETVIGAADFHGQGRARMSGRDRGCLRVYADRESGRILGAGMCIPDGEHIGHLLAWAIQQRLSLFDLLQMPYYHPTIEEGLRSAIRAARDQCETPQRGLPAGMCDRLPVKGLD